MSAAANLSSDAPGVERWIDVPCDWRRPSASGAFTVWRDAARKFGQLLPRPTPEEIPAYYDVDYYTHSGEPATTPRQRSFAWKLLRHLAWRADKGIEPTDAWWAQTLGDAPKSCLEIGCGNGDTLARLKAMGHVVTGVEPDPAARADAEDRGLAVFAGTAETLPEPVRDRRFDCVLMIHSLEHCLDPVLALANARALLAAAGRLVVEVPNNACAGIDHFGHDWLFLDLPRHLNFFTAASLRAFAEASGFRVVRFDHLGYTMQFLPDWIRQQDAICKAFGDDPAINGLVSHLRYFLRTAVAPDDAKYCSIRMTAAALNRHDANA